MQRVQDRIDREVALGWVTYNDDTFTMQPHDTLVLSAGNAKTITLPSVAEAQGKIYTIVKTAADGTLTIDHAGDSVSTGQTAAEAVASDVALTHEDNFLCLFSTGLHWITLASKIGD